MVRKEIKDSNVMHLHRKKLTLVQDITLSYFAAERTRQVIVAGVFIVGVLSFRSDHPFHMVMNLTTKKCWY